MDGGEKENPQPEVLMPKSPSKRLLLKGAAATAMAAAASLLLPTAETTHAGGSNRNTISKRKTLPEPDNATPVDTIPKKEMDQNMDWDRLLQRFMGAKLPDPNDKQIFQLQIEILGKYDKLLRKRLGAYRKVVDATKYPNGVSVLVDNFARLKGAMDLIQVEQVVPYYSTENKLYGDYLYLDSLASFIEWFDRYRPGDKDAAKSIKDHASGIKRRLDPKESQKDTAHPDEIRLGNITIRPNKTARLTAAEKAILVSDAKMIEDYFKEASPNIFTIPMVIEVVPGGGGGGVFFGMDNRLTGEETNKIVIERAQFEKGDPGPMKILLHEAGHLKTASLNALLSLVLTPGELHDRIVTEQHALWDPNWGAQDQTVEQILKHPPGIPASGPISQEQFVGLINSYPRYVIKSDYMNTREIDGKQVSITIYDMCVKDKHPPPPIEVSAEDAKLEYPNSVVPTRILELVKEKANQPNGHRRWKLTAWFLEKFQSEIIKSLGPGSTSLEDALEQFTTLAENVGLYAAFLNGNTEITNLFPDPLERKRIQDRVLLRRISARDELLAEGMAYASIYRDRLDPNNPYRKLNDQAELYFQRISREKTAQINQQTAIIADFEKLHSSIIV